MMMSQISGGHFGPARSRLATASRASVPVSAGRGRAVAGVIVVPLALYTSWMWISGLFLRRVGRRKSAMVGSASHTTLLSVSGSETTATRPAGPQREGR